VAWHIYAGAGAACHRKSLEPGFTGKYQSNDGYWTGVHGETVISTSVVVVTIMLGYCLL